MIRKMPREVHDVYFNQENNKDKYQLLDYSKGEDEFDAEESLEDLPQPRRLAMHRANASNAKAIKMGTIMEINEEDDYERIMSSR